MNLHRKIIIHHNLHQNHIQEAVAQVGAVGDLEAEEAEEVGLVVAVDGDNLLQEVLAQTIHL